MTPDLPERFVEIDRQRIRKNRFVVGFRLI
jgi:hypothetical protein